MPQTESESCKISELRKEYGIAYEAALKKFEKYDKPLKKGMTEVLKMNPDKAKKAGALYGRQAQLAGDKTKQAIGFTDKLRAGVQAGASVIAAEAYKGGKVVGEKIAERLTQRDQETQAASVGTGEIINLPSDKAMGDFIDKVSKPVKPAAPNAEVTSVPKRQYLRSTIKKKHPPSASFN